MKQDVKKGRPRKYDYKGNKKITSIRLSDAEKELILKTHENIQGWIQSCLKQLFRSK